MITEATIRRVKYPPELIPDSWNGAVPLAGEVVPPILDLRRFAPNIATLTNIQLAPAANAQLRIRYDNTRIQENTAAMILDAAGASIVGAWSLPAKEILYYNLFGVGAIASYTTHYGVWVAIPTVARKLLMGIKLTPSELALSQELGIANTVEKGLLPLPICQQIERQYHVLGEETHSRNINIAAAGPVYTIESLYPANLNEILVLTRVAAAPATAAQNVHLYVDRDEDAAFANIGVFSLALTVGGEIKCFIPATTEIRLTADAGVAPGWHLFRYTFQRIKLNNILRVRFGLVSEDEVPADTWKKVKGGIL